MLCYATYRYRRIKRRPKVQKDLVGRYADVNPGEIPPPFQVILDELDKFQAQLGGKRNFQGAPELSGKITRSDFRGYTAYEYVYLTIVGFAYLHNKRNEIVEANNGRFFTQNPGVQMLEQVCGMTMHADRAGSENLLRSGPDILLEAFRVAQTKEETVGFFTDAFDRTADPCLEGRIGRLNEYLQKNLGASADDVTLDLKPDDPASAVVGKHLRVFRVECIREWSRQHSMTYGAAEKVWNEDDPQYTKSIEAVFNALTFEGALARKGVVAQLPTEDIRQEIANLVENLTLPAAPQ